MKKKGDLARQMLSEKDTYIQQILSNNDSGSNNGNINNNNSNAAGSGKGANNSSSSSSSNSGSSISSGGGDAVQGNTESHNTTSTASSSSAPSSSTGGQRLSDSYPSPAPSTITTVPSNQSSSNSSSSTTPNHQSQSQSQGREGRVGVGSNRSGTLTQTDHDQQAYLKQAFCGFVKAKEAVEMEHLGTLTSHNIASHRITSHHITLKCITLNHSTQLSVIQIHLHPIFIRSASSSLSPLLSSITWSYSSFLLAIHLKICQPIPPPLALSRACNMRNLRSQFRRAGYGYGGDHTANSGCCRHICSTILCF